MDAKHSLGEPRLLISRSALLHNARLLRRTCTPGVKICAMIKADAYGHGGAIVSDALANLRQDEDSAPTADQLAVATIDEAIQLPADLKLPLTILRQVENVFLGRQRESIEHAIRRGWTLTLASQSAADDVARVALSAGKFGYVHVMVDTGLTRCGVPVAQLDALLDRIEHLPSLRLASISTHFANSEIPQDRFTADQLRRFMHATDEFAEKRRGKVLRHAANTGGIFFSPGAQFDMVRPGIGLYGIDPLSRPSVDRPLRPVMKWTAPLIAIHEAKTGTSVGYNQTFKVAADMRIGLVPIGYADGYSRSFGNRALMTLAGARCPVVGRVSMDLTTIDITRVPHPMIGDEVIVMDDDPLAENSAYALSSLLDTIPYELFTRIGSRVRRVGIEPEDSSVEIVEEIDGPADERG